MPGLSPSPGSRVPVSSVVTITSLISRVVIQRLPRGKGLRRQRSSTQARMSVTGVFGMRQGLFMCRPVAPVSAVGTLAP